MNDTYLIRSATAPRHDGGSGAAKDQLEEELAPEGHGRRQGVVIERQVLPAQNEQVLGAHKGVVAAEHQPPPQQHEAQRRHRKDDKVLGQDVDGVLGPRKAGLHRGEPQVHKEHQDGRQQHPQRVHDRDHIHSDSSLNRRRAGPAAPPRRVSAAGARALAAEKGQAQHSLVAVRARPFADGTGKTKAPEEVPPAPLPCVQYTPAGSTCQVGADSFSTLCFIHKTKKIFSCNIHKIQTSPSDRPPPRRIEWPRPIITKQRSIRYGSRNFAHPQLRRPPVRPHGRRQRHRHGGRLYCQPRHRGGRPGRRHRDRGPGVQPLAGREQHHRTALRGLRPGGRKARLPSRPHRGRADLFRPGHPGPPGK